MRGTNHLSPLFCGGGHDPFILFRSCESSVVHGLDVGTVRGEDEPEGLDKVEALVFAETGQKGDLMRSKNEQVWR